MSVGLVSVGLVSVGLVSESIASRRENAAGWGEGVGTLSLAVLQSPGFLLNSIGSHKNLEEEETMMIVKS